MSVEQFNLAMLVGAAVLLVAIIAVRVSTGTGLPSLLIYLGIGILLGEDVIGVQFDDPEVAQVLGYAALVVILAEGGLTTNWEMIRPVTPVAATLASVGVGVSAVTTAVCAYWLIDVDWQLAILLGVVLSPTDAAAVFSVLRRVPLPRRLAGVLEAESGFNDAPAAILVVALSSATWDETPLHLLLANVAYQLAAGAIAGLVVGRLGAAGVRRLALPASGLYPLAILALVISAYALSSVVGGNGFIATYVSALVLGNAHLPHRPATRSFAEGLAWLAQIGLFVMLGLLVTPRMLGEAVLPALAVGFALLLVARPMSVLACALPFRVALREQLFVSWAALRGAVPIVFATVPLVEQVGNGQLLFNIVFVLVVAFTLLQGPTLPFVARLLRLTAPEEPRDVEVEAAPLGDLGADLLQVRVPPGSRLHGVAISELRLPRDVGVSLIVREGRSFVPGPSTVLRHLDDLLVVAPETARDATERRLRAVGRRGRLAGWFGERGL